jgi:hypothetical protein
MFPEGDYKGMTLAEAAEHAHKVGDDLVVVKTIKEDGTERAFGIPWEPRDHRVTVCTDHKDRIIAVYGRG